jgi:hypothetical protein
MKNKTVEMCPSWVTICEILFLVLENPKADRESKEEAKSQIMRLAKFADQENRKAREKDQCES